MKSKIAKHFQIFSNPNFQNLGLWYTCKSLTHYRYELLSCLMHATVHKNIHTTILMHACSHICLNFTSITILYMIYIPLGCINNCLADKHVTSTELVDNTYCIIYIYNQYV